MPIGFTDNNHDEQSGYADSQSSSDATQQSSSSQTDIPEFEDLTSTDTNRGLSLIHISEPTRRS